MAWIQQSTVNIGCLFWHSIAGFAPEQPATVIITNTGDPHIHWRWQQTEWRAVICYAKQLTTVSFLNINEEVVVARFTAYLDGHRSPFIHLNQQSITWSSFQILCLSGWYDWVLDMALWEIVVLPPGLSSTLTSSQMEDWDLSYLGIPLRTKLQRFSSLTAEPTLTLLVRTWDIQRAYSVEIDFLFILWYAIGGRLIIVFFRKIK